MPIAVWTPLWVPLATGTTTQTVLKSAQIHNTPHTAFYRQIACTTVPQLMPWPANCCHGWVAAVAKCQIGPPTFERAASQSHQWQQSPDQQPTQSLRGAIRPLENLAVAVVGSVPATFAGPAPHQPHYKSNQPHPSWVHSEIPRNRCQSCCL